MVYYYKLFGLILRSEIILEQLLEQTDDYGSFDIDFKIGICPVDLINTANIVKPFSRFNDIEFIFVVPQIAKYYVTNGNLIVVEPISDDLNNVLSFFYTNAITAALFQRGMMPIHASAVKVNNTQVVLFPAPSGYGKSTTAIFLAQKGYPVFSDDTVVLMQNENKIFAIPSFPIIKLWSNTIAAQNIFGQEDGIAIVKGISKYSLSLKNNFDALPMEVAAIVFLDKLTEKFEIEKLTALKSILLLGNNIYRKQWVKGMKVHQNQFQILTSVVNKVPGHIAYRPDRVNTFESFADLIDKTILQKVNE